MLDKSLKPMSSEKGSFMRRDREGDCSVSFPL